MSRSDNSWMKGCILAGFLVAVFAIVGVAVVFLARTPQPDQPAGVAGTAPVPATPSSPTAPPAAGAALERIRSSGVLKVAMDTGEPEMSGTPPMFFVDAQGGRDGFDYALARRLATALGARDVELVHGKYSTLEDLLQGPTVDILLSGYSPTDTAGIAWSSPYLEYGLCLVVPAASKITTTNDLFGKKIGIFDDDAAAEEVQKLVKGYTGLVRMEDGYWDALLAGQFDAFLYDYPYTVAELNAWQAAHPDRPGAFRIAQYNLTDSTYAVGVRASEPDLLAAVNSAIEAWRSSDDYGVAVKRYLKGGLATVVTDTKARRVVVKKGDTLSGIAQRELGDTDKWKDIWALNRSRFPNPHLIEVGDEVLLP